MVARHKDGIYLFSSLPSTQDKGWELFAGGASSGTVVVAGTQSAGRGRRSRKWASPKGGLWFSVILFPVTDRRAVGLPLLACRTLSAVLYLKFGVDTRVKLPNDLYYRDRKLAGILVERRDDCVVLGVGVNVNCNTDGLPFPAVSLREILGRRVSRWELCVDFRRMLSGELGKRTAHF